MKPGAWPDFAKMLMTIKQAGYQSILDGTKLRVTGKVVMEGGGLLIQVDGLKSPMSLWITATKGDPDIAADVARNVGATVELEGNWQAAADGKSPDTLAVTAIYGTEKPDK